MSCKNTCCNGQGAKCAELDTILEQYGSIPGSLITILQKTQELFGYLPAEAMDVIAEKTGIKPAKLYGVATFYTQFRLKPIGKHLLMLCKGTACHVNGADRIEEAITEELGISDGETTGDGLFTLNNVACLGCCSLAPVMMIRTGDRSETYGNLTPETVKEVLREIRAKEVE